jgi:hypothetical protein
MKHSHHSASGEKTSSRKAGFGQLAKAVFFSFIGVSRRADHEADAAKITPVQAIIAGIIGVALLIAGLLILVSMVTK